MNAWVVILFAAAVAAFTLVAAVYNRLVRLKARCVNAFAQIEVQLKRRYDLIPSLVECVKGSMRHERETLERVIAARNEAAAGLQRAAGLAADSDAVRTWMQAEGSLAGALGRLSAVIESYPDLKASASVTSLTEELTTTENRIAFARQVYNDHVARFNTVRETFPTCAVAGLVGFKESRNFLEFADREALTQAPRVVMA